ncbi:hypothetical protein P6U16_12605 [Rhizobium sp. 32-5/1]|uniref:hypothetical protein n=1 Tax=Rhizobium sp. 32-5/1 TaxID=3019602 RepID=UPI00240D52AB|nr:hypothetical protein [Rhizobium sp. 32-5/1]WEZ85261.1 hypothetical protein P6U16_12605 [Rhizobium sp. 32-5/1]
MRQRVDAGNGGGAERDAGEEDVEALEAATHLPQCQSESESDRRAKALRNDIGSDPHAVTTALR